MPTVVWSVGLGGQAVVLAGGHEGRAGSCPDGQVWCTGSWVSWVGLAGSLRAGSLADVGGGQAVTQAGRLAVRWAGVAAWQLGGPAIALTFGCNMQPVRWAVGSPFGMASCHLGWRAGTLAVRRAGGVGDGLAGKGADGLAGWWSGGLVRQAGSCNVSGVWWTVSSVLNVYKSIYPIR
jgi:hypothetical protein